MKLLFGFVTYLVMIPNMFKFQIFLDEITLEVGANCIFCVSLKRKRKLLTRREYRDKETRKKATGI